jgi:hypothetical protein
MKTFDLNGRTVSVHSPDDAPFLWVRRIRKWRLSFLPSSQAPVGLGEPGTIPVAPAIGNAIVAASGARVRHLPIQPQAVLEALAQRR